MVAVSGIRYGFGRLNLSEQDPKGSKMPWVSRLATCFLVGRGKSGGLSYLNKMTSRADSACPVDEINNRPIQLLDIGARSPMKLLLTDS